MFNRLPYLFFLSLVLLASSTNDYLCLFNSNNCALTTGGTDTKYDCDNCQNNLGEFINLPNLSFETPYFKFGSVNINIQSFTSGTCGTQNGTQNLIKPTCGQLYIITDRGTYQSYKFVTGTTAC